MELNRCRVCGDPLGVGARSCAICLEPVGRAPLRMSRGTLLRSLAAAAVFFATTTFFIAPAARLADPMTLIDVRALPGYRFPIVVVTAGVPHVALERDPWHIAPPPRGSSYFVNPAHAAELQRALNAAPPPPDGGWRLRVEELGLKRERIELTFVHDGYDGSIYEATPTSIRPLQRRLTGPGFAILVGDCALAMNAVVWIVAVIARWMIGVRRQRD